MKKMTLIIGAALLVLMLAVVSSTASAKGCAPVDGAITIHVRDSFLYQPVISTITLSDGNGFVKQVGGVADNTFELMDVKRGIYTVTVNTGTGQTGTAKFCIYSDGKTYDRTIYVNWVAPPEIWQRKGLSYATFWSPDGKELLAIKFGASAGEREFIEAGRDMGMTFTNPELGVWIFKDGTTRATLQATPDYPW